MQTLFTVSWFSQFSWSKYCGRYTIKKLTYQIQVLVMGGTYRGGGMGRLVFDPTSTFGKKNFFIFASIRSRSLQNKCSMLELIIFSISGDCKQKVVLVPQLPMGRGGCLRLYGTYQSKLQLFLSPLT